MFFGKKIGGNRFTAQISSGTDYFLEYISRAGYASTVVIAMRPYGSVIVTYRDRIAKDVAGITIRGGELGLLQPVGVSPAEAGQH